MIVYYRWRAYASFEAFLDEVEAKGDGLLQSVKTRNYVIGRWYELPVEREFVLTMVHATIPAAAFYYVATE